MFKVDITVTAFRGIEQVTFFQTFVSAVRDDAILAAADWVGEIAKTYTICTIFQQILDLRN